MPCLSNCRPERGGGSGPGHSSNVVTLLIWLLAVAGCTLPTGPPLYSPVGRAGAFGYTEQRLSNSHFRVTYTAPRVTIYTLSRIDRSLGSDEQLALAYDIALWRAADLSLQNGQPGFAVEKRENDARVEVIRDPYPYRSFGYRPYYGRYRYDPFYYDPFYYDPFYYRDYAVICARVILIVELRRRRGPRVFDARETLHRLQAKYPNEMPLSG